MNEPLWKQWRHEFPVTERLIYVNHAAVAPLSRRAGVAMQELAQDLMENGAIHYEAWLKTYDAVRAVAARLINAAPGEIALVKNTSEGIAQIARGLTWKPGDVIVAFEEEFPANYCPWKVLEGEGVTVRWLSVYDPLDRIDEACKGARLLAISFVQYLNGFRADLNAIGEICHRRGCFFFVDAIQGLGVFPLDVERAHIDALASDGHKWLMGTEGCGILYIRQSRQDEIAPLELGWTNFAKFEDYSSRDTALRHDAGRYEPGTLNTIGCYGLRAAIELLLEVGIDRIGPAVEHLGDLSWQGLEAMGCEMLGRRTPGTGAGIVSFRKPGIEPHMLTRRLRNAGIIAASRAGWVRLAPHFYIAPEEIGRVLDEVRQA